MRGPAGGGEREAGGVRRKGPRRAHPAAQEPKMELRMRTSSSSSQSEARAGRDLEGGFTKLVFFK